MPNYGLKTGLMKLDSDGCIVETDSLSADIIARRPKELIGTSIFELTGLAPMPLEALRDALVSEPNSITTDEFVVRLCRLSQDWYGVVHDVTDVRIAHHEGARQEAREEARMLISGFAHEVRNPIAAILSMAEALLHSSKVSEFGKEMLQPVPGLVRRIESVISDSVNYSRPNDPVPARVDAERVVVEVLANHPPPDDVEVVVEDTARAPTVLVDPWHTRRIVMALLENAYESGADRVQVNVDAFPETGTRLGVSIEVIDNGEGVSERDRPNIFRPFFTTRAEKTGLGLATGRTLACLNQGRLRFVESSEDETRFELLLPEGVGANLGEAVDHVG